MAAASSPRRPNTACGLSEWISTQDGTAERVSADIALAHQLLLADQDRAARDLYLRSVTLSREASSLLQVRVEYMVIWRGSSHAVSSGLMKESASLQRSLLQPSCGTSASAGATAGARNPRPLESNSTYGGALTSVFHQPAEMEGIVK
jgi:hypothetical protein